MLEKKTKSTRPLKCDECTSGNVELCNNKIIYGTPKGEWPLMYHCKDCGAAVSCHPQTDIPMGCMATQATRQARGRAHKCFDKLWKEGLISRDKAYADLASFLMVNINNCHMSMFNEETCHDVINFSKQRLKDLRLLKKGVIYKQGKRTKRRY